MKRLFFVLLLMVSSSTTVWATTLYNCPLAWCPEPSAWFDHDKIQNGTSLRYDGGVGYPYDYHFGTDFPASIGDSVYAAAAGELYYSLDGCPEPGDPDYVSGSSGSITCGGYLGNHVRIQHLDGRVTVYAHLKRGSVPWRLSVLCGAKVGEVGMSGYTTGPHAHIDLWWDSSGVPSQRKDFYGGVSNNYISYWTLWNNPNGGCQ